MEEYSYVYTGGKLMQMVLKTTTTPVDGDATTTTETLNFTYDASGTPMSVKYDNTAYYYVVNIQGDIMAILNTSGEAVVEYTYDAWGKLYSTIGTLADTLGEVNPLTYRGYVYDRDSELYYLQSRYYDPEVGRFINADALASTGYGILGNNMFAYCNNNPVSYADTLGTAPWPTTYVSKDAYPRSSNLYKSMNNAAVAFARENYGRTRKEGIEYGSIIYSKTVAGSTYYTYGWRIKGTEEDISVTLDSEPDMLASGWDIVGFIHTHPNDTGFSDQDIITHMDILAFNKSFNSYVVFSGGGTKFIIWSLRTGLVYPYPGAGMLNRPGTRKECLF